MTQLEGIDETGETEGVDYGNRSREGSDRPEREIQREQIFQVMAIPGTGKNWEDWNRNGGSWE